MAFFDTSVENESGWEQKKQPSHHVLHLLPAISQNRLYGHETEEL